MRVSLYEGKRIVRYYFFLRLILKENLQSFLLLPLSTEVFFILLPTTYYTIINTYLLLNFHWDSFSNPT